jgi:hypothetical protein
MGQMKLEILLQFIVPLSFLAIWALTSLLNRDAQPLPPRPTRGPGPGGMRPGLPPSDRGEPGGAARYQVAGRLSPAAGERPGAAQWSGPLVQDRRGGLGRATGPDPGIVILESQVREAQPASSSSNFSPSSAASARAARGTTTRRGPLRGRSAPAAASLKPVEPERPRALTGLVSQALVPKKAQHLEITPLASPLKPLSASLTKASAGTSPEPPGAHPLPTALSSGELRTMLASPGKLREVALLTELLQPPLALRPPRRLR